MKQLIKYISLFILLLTSFKLNAKSEADAYDWQSPFLLRAEVEHLCDTLMQGRGFGSGGNQIAAYYLLRQFRSEGLRASVQSFCDGDKIGHNIVAVTPGWYKQYIVVGAYYDGLGKIGDKTYPCADSNGSGVAALLSVARSLPSACKGSIGVIFVAFDGHNADLSGSRAFIERNLSEYRIALMVNLDLLGSSLSPPNAKRTDYLIALGGEQYKFLIESANRIDRLDLSYDYYGSARFTEIFYRSLGDQKAFLEAGIPAVMFTSGITQHTNKVTDLPSSLDYPVFARRVSMIQKWLVYMLRRNQL